MGLNTDRFKTGHFENIPKNEPFEKKKFSFLKRPYEYEFQDINVLGTLNNDNFEITELRVPPRYWVLSPTADGTTSTPTLHLDYRFDSRIFFIDISSYAVVVSLPPMTECSPGTNFKFILNSTSEGENSKNFGIITDSTDTNINGYIAGGANMHITADTSSVYWDTSDAVARSGDWCELITDGTAWYIKGHAIEANAIDIADGHDVTT